MRKETYEINLNYEFYAERKGAKYTIDGGQHFMNHGEFCEVLAKSVLGYEAKKDANTRFDKGEDIKELNASIKSWNCGLTDTKLGNSREEFLRKFWEMSNDFVTYIWVSDHDEMVDLYYMNEPEFKVFTNRFGSWDKHSNKIRFKTSANKIVSWLELLVD